MEKPECIRCESDRLEEVWIELLGNKSWDAWYKCEECGEEFGLRYVEDDVIEWWN